MKLGVCVPYRNREEHLKEFVPRISKHLENQGIEFHIYICHQVDDKLFNRGATKNIAAKQAFEDGCDYIVWHDIDMIPEEGCDYSFPDKYPVHIATKISQMDYKLKYEEYFGGAVIFSKEHVENTNGYSNNYWDWGMEDDDLFWRCRMEGYLRVNHLDFDEILTYGKFNGKNSYVEIPITRTLRSINSKNHTISVLVRAEQQEEKVPIWLVGDKERRFCEYPILRRSGWDYGISYNNSRAFTAQLWNKDREHIYQWIKRYEHQWSWITLKVEENKIHFYLNGKESDAKWGTGTDSPRTFNGKLLRYGTKPFYLGTTNSVPETDVNKWFRGDIADVRVYNRGLSDYEIKNLHKEVVDDGLIIHYTGKTGLVNDLSGNGNTGTSYNVEFSEEPIFIPNTIIPYRREGRMECLPHEDEGLITVGGVQKWAKGETTARNEKRYVLQMQQEKIDYKNDGIKQVEFELVNKTPISDKATMLNIRL
jgi:hypothetical protein